jgi:hypothetical protein
MSTPYIESLKWDVLKFASDPALKATLETAFAQLVTDNATNFEAILPLRHVDMHAQQIHWYSMTQGEDYETARWYTYKDPFTGSYEEVTDEVRDERLDEARDCLAAAEEDAECGDHVVALRDVHTAINSARDAIDFCKERGFDGSKHLHGLLRFLPALEKLLNEVTPRAETYAQVAKLVENIEDADSESSELMWNTSWQPYGDDVDKDIANRVPQVCWVQKTTEDSDDTFLTLTCIGQDNGPALMAYVVLAHGVVPIDYVRYWTRERDWTQHVIGTDLFLECAEKLGVKPQLEAVLAQDEKERKERAAKAEADRKAREEMIAAVKANPLPEAFQPVLTDRYNLDAETSLRECSGDLLSVCRDNATLLTAYSNLLSAFERATVFDVLHHYYPDRYYPTVPTP